MGRIVIDVSHATKMIEGHDLVRDLTFSIPQGQLFGLIGPSGGGKTSAVRLMVGAYAPTAGRVRVFGTDATRLTIAQRERIGYMPQQAFLYPTLTASENLAFIAGIYGIGWLRRRKLIHGVLREMEIWDARDRLTKDLSGGMLRRLQLAAVMLPDPELMFIDEPMAGLDPLLRGKLWDILRSLRDRGKTILMTTQIIQEAERCDEVLLLKDGRTVALGTPEELCQRAFGGEVVRVLVGGPLHEATAAFWETPGVREVTPLSANAVRLVTRPDRYALERAVAEARQRGVDVQAIESATPSFDEVFQRLVTGA